jgi:hypothetical protein
MKKKKTLETIVLAMEKVEERQEKPVDQGVENTC